MTDAFGLSQSFSSASGSVQAEQRGEDGTRPFSIRLTRAERASLETRAGQQPLGTYIRNLLLGDGAKKRHATRKPHLDDRKVSALLAALGQSHLSSNLNQLARSANMGTLEVDEDVQRQLQQACAAVVAMREALLIALRISPRG